MNTKIILISLLLVLMPIFAQQNSTASESERQDVMLTSIHIGFAQIIDALVYKNHLYVLRRPENIESQLELVTFSIINPSSPLLINIDSLSDIGHSAKLSVKDFVLYAWGSENIILCDITNLDDPQIKKKMPSNGVLSFHTLGNHGIKKGFSYLGKRLNLEDPWNPKFSKAEEENINYSGLAKKPRSLKFIHPDKIIVNDYYRILENVEESYVAIIRDCLFKLHEKQEKTENKQKKQRK